MWEYWNAEKAGLKNVASVDWLRGTGCYEWDDTTILFDPSARKFYWETAGGCSCNGPLEDVKRLDDPESGSLFDLSVELNKIMIEYTTDPDIRSQLAVQVVQAMEACLKVWDA